MVQAYTAVYFTVEPREPGADILLAQLAEFPFESFEETETGLHAYIPTADFDPLILNEIDILSDPAFRIEYTQETIAPVNWNEAWESHFEPIMVDGVCHIRAPFHPANESTYDIIIEPKMSFGTGHHETTHMMVQFLLELELNNKKTLDMGSGTAVLAILAAKKGAKPVMAIDNDEWCFLNAQENAERNHCTEIQVVLGDASAIGNETFEVIIANINRNILLQDMAVYCRALLPKGTLLLSGFYQEDVAAIEACCTSFGLTLQNAKNRNNWAGLQFSFNN
ncbi:MAG: 50S ribosomal protein L11 methyltransferase [Flavobacterium sp. BFFFF2]|nr:MAG: 50S ribosomal protein L11 methyltransferase [Flavobacterium sp. BFFFF2]